MFLPFFQALRQEGVPTSLPEFLTFLQAMAAGVVALDPEAFYHLARTTLVKDERHIDRFDRAFARSFSGLAEISPDAVLTALNLPANWLEKLTEGNLTTEERAAVQALGGFAQLMETLRQRLAEQQGRHQGGSKWVGTAGTSPFGAWGYNPEGVRIGQDQGRHGRAVKVWDQRQFRNLAGDAALGTRTLQLALRRLRRWARDGATEELDLDQTIRATAAQGWLEVKTRAPRRNAVKVLLLLDSGGSMDPYTQLMETLFTAARAEFRHLEVFYFHNCVYAGLWRDNHHRHDAQTPTHDVIRTYGPDWRLILVGDAAMSPYEITHPGGANDHWNPEAGAVWLTRLCQQWPQHLWINPVAESHWDHSRSTALIRQIVEDRMVPMTLEGLAGGTDLLR